MSRFNYIDTFDDVTLNLGTLLRVSSVPSTGSQLVRDMKTTQNTKIFLYLGRFKSKLAGSLAVRSEALNKETLTARSLQTYASYVRLG